MLNWVFEGLPPLVMKRLSCNFIIEKSTKMTSIVTRIVILSTIIILNGDLLSQSSNSVKWQNEPYGKFETSSELVDRRDQNSKHFRNSDGTITAYIAAGALNYQENGQWKTIFHSIEEVEEGFVNKDNLFKTFYPKNSQGCIKTILQNGSEVLDMLDMRMYFLADNIEVGSYYVQPVQGSITFNELRYPNVYGQGIDLRLTQNTNQRKMDYIIANKQSLGSIPNNAEWLIFEEKVKLPFGWKAVLSGKEIFVMNEANVLQLIYEKPVFTDSPIHDHDHEALDANESCSKDHSAPMFIGEYDLLQEGDFLIIRTKVSLSWLLDSKRSFPVFIDPTVNCTPDNTANWTGYHRTSSGTSSANEGSATYTSTTIDATSDDNIKLGRNGGTGSYQGWMKFNISGLPDNACINSAVINYYVYANSSSQSDCRVWNRLRHMNADPVSATASNRLTDIRDGLIYDDRNISLNGTGNGWKNVPITNNLDQLTSQLSVDWFATGFHTYAGASGHNTCNIDIYGRSNASKPYLTVVYAAVNAGVDISICSGDSQVLSGSTSDATTSTTTTGSATFTYSGSGWDYNGFSVGGTTSGMPASATITSVSVTGSTGVSCSWSSMDFVVNGSFVNWYCNGTWAYNGLNGALANGQQFLIYSYDEDWWDDYITMTLSVTVNYSYTTTNSPTLSWSGGPIVSGSNTLTPTVNPTSTTTYTLTATTNGCNSSDQVTVTVDSPLGNPSVFGDNIWNVYGYNGDNTNLTSNSYRGYYVQPNLGSGNFGVSTTSFWSSGGSPSDAGTTINNGNLWNGCAVNIDYHTVVQKRKGFPCSTYNFNMLDWDDETRVYLDGNLIWSCTGWSGSGTCPTGNIGMFELDANSELEIRSFEQVGGSNVNMQIIAVSPTELAVNGSTRTCLVSGGVDFVHFIDANGKLIASINPNGNNLGNVTMTSYVDPTNALVPACTSTNPIYATSVMERHWVITPSIQPSTVVTVKLPFLNSEYTNLMNAANSNVNGNDDVSMINDILLSKYSGPLNVNSNAPDNCPANGGSGGTTTHNQVSNGLTSTYSNVTGAYFTDFSITGFSEFWLHGFTDLSPLPVTLNSLSTDCNGEDNVLINWVTQTENNTSHYTVESSQDGLIWKVVGTVNAAGNSTSELVYQLEDIENRGMITTYYRLNQYDLDGNNVLFGPVTAECTLQESGFNVFPNPSSSEVTISIYGINETEETFISFYNVEGKLIKKIACNNLSNQMLYVDVSELATGCYFVQLIQGGENIQNIKWVKQ